jgi:hypothetical protein
VETETDGPRIDDEVTPGWLLKSLARGFIDTLRRNKLATALATLTLVVLIALALNNRFEGLPHYQQSILPRLVRLETVFLVGLRKTEIASGEWRRYYFEESHRQIKDILRASRLERPTSYVARRKHRQFIRYYELLDQEFHTLAAQAQADPNSDYLQKFTARMEELRLIRDEWAQWAGQKRA